MFDKVKNSLPKGIRSRIFILTVIFTLMAGVLIYRLFVLQIIRGESYQSDFSLSIRKEKVLPSTRGQIYDCNGKVLAYNRLSYNVTFEDNGSYSSTHERNLTLNSILYRAVEIIRSHGDEPTNRFRIVLNDNGEYVYNCRGFTLSRFKADIFGKPYIDDLTEEQLSITAPDLMELLCSPTYYGILDPKTTAKEREACGLPETFSTEDLLLLTYLRSELAANNFQRYYAITVAEDVCEETVSQLLENAALLQGIDVEEGYLRVYSDAEYFAPIIGYTGRISAEELQELRAVDPSYSGDDIVGKVGMEKEMETSLKGDKGSEVIYVDNMGRTLSVEDRVEPQAGNSLYLTIDSDLQRTVYNILEQYIAGIVYANTIDSESINYDYLQSADDVVIPVYDIYFSLFENNVLDVDHLSTADASPNEAHVYRLFREKADSIFAQIKAQLTTNDPTPYGELTEEMQVYQSYIVNQMLRNTGILNWDAIDTTDLTWLAWSEQETISLQEFLTYAISMNWIDVNGIADGIDYMDSGEIYTRLADYIAENLSGDTDFCKRVFRYMLREGSLSGTEVCLLLFDQGVLDMNTADYDALSDGSMSAYDFILNAIYTLRIRPSQLALRPCSGAAVVTDPLTGAVKACVTYPGYDNNRLVNNMDSDYYGKLATDLSSPFYSRATQETLAPGSTFKIVTATAGVMEGAVTIDEGIGCTGEFKEVDPPVKCWVYPGAHGYETLQTAIKDSCNYYFNTVGYRLAVTGDGTFSDSYGVDILARYASMYGFDAKSGVEVPESAPHLATYDSVRMAMGQSDNAFTITQIARYVSTIANKGTCYDLTLIDRTTDFNGNTIDNHEPVVHSLVELPEQLWTAIHGGMRSMVQNHSAFSNYSGVAVAGKTGTAQETTLRPNHALFIGFAPYEAPEMAIACRIANGYSSATTAALARDIITYYFDRSTEATLVTGHAAQVTEGNTSND